MRYENYLTELSSADTKQANAALEALRIAGPETHLMSEGLWALATRPAEEVSTTVVRTSPTEIVLVAASEAGYQDGKQKVELQLHLSDDGEARYNNGYRLPDPTIFVSETDGTNLRQFWLTRDLAVWAMCGVARHLGEHQACKTGLVQSFHVDYHLEGDLRDALNDDHGLFLGLGLHTLAKDITQATRVRERFAPVPKDQPLLLDRARPWSPAEYVVPAGRVVEDVLDIPLDAVFTAVWDNPGSEHVIDGSEGRGVSPLIRLLHTAHAEAGGDISTAAPDTERRRTTTSIWRPWAPTGVEDRALYAARYVIHTGEGPTLRELGGRRNQWGAIVDKTADERYHSNSVVIPKGTDDGYTGPLPGNPHRRIRWDDTDDGVTIVLTTQDEDGEWEDLDSTQVSDTAEEGAIEAAEDQLLKQHQLCWADIDNARDTEPTAEDDPIEVVEPRRYFNEAGEEIPEWEAQLLGLTEEETGE
jgi:hypothetical protein